ncbi:unnamed protein product [Mucor hiemalis]
MQFELAVYWLKKAAEGGFRSYDISLLLGVIYFVGGGGVAVDEKEAMVWITEAASYQPTCLGLVGDWFMHGPSKHALPIPAIKIDYKRALMLYDEAIKVNVKDSGSVAKMAHIYFTGGYGVQKNYEKALLYAEQVSHFERGSVIKTMIKIYGQGGFGVTKDLDKAFELCEDEVDVFISPERGFLHQFCVYPPEYLKAFENYERAIERFPEEMSPRIGMMYLKGLGVEKNLATACSFIDQSTSPYWKGFMETSGISGVKINYRSAFEWYESTTSNDEYYGQALNAIGKLYQQGLGVKQSHKKANEYFILAAENNCSEAYNSFGDMYKYGYNVDVDNYKAFEWYSKAAEEPFDNGGQFNLGMMYIEGKGTEFNPERALYWFERAYTFGNEQVNSSFITLAKVLAEQAPLTKKKSLQFFHLENHQKSNSANADEEVDV